MPSADSMCDVEEPEEEEGEEDELMEARSWGLRETPRMSLLWCYHWTETYENTSAAKIITKYLFTKIILEATNFVIITKTPCIQLKQARERPQIITERIVSGNSFVIISARMVRNLGGRFGYFLFFSALGGGKGQSEAPAGGGIGFLLKIPGGGGGFQEGEGPRGREGPGGCVR